MCRSNRSGSKFLTHWKLHDVFTAVYGDRVFYLCPFESKRKPLLVIKGLYTALPHQLFLILLIADAFFFFFFFSHLLLTVHSFICYYNFLKIFKIAMIKQYLVYQLIVPVYRSWKVLVMSFRTWCIYLNVSTRYFVTR